MSACCKAWLRCKLSWMRFVVDWKMTGSSERCPPARKFLDGFSLCTSASYLQPIKDQASNGMSAINVMFAYLCSVMGRTQIDWGGCILENMTDIQARCHRTCDLEPL
jgi:hypothetical protein